MVATVVPKPLQPLELTARGALLLRSAKATVCGVPDSVAARELAVVHSRLGLSEDELCTETVVARGAGNTLAVTLTFESITEVFVGFGAKGVSAERVASSVCREARDYLRCDAPVGSHLADQLILPLALAGGGVFRTVPPSEHTRTQVELVQELLDVRVALIEEPRRPQASASTFRVEVRRC